MSHPNQLRMEERGTAIKPVEALTFFDGRFVEIASSLTDDILGMTEMELSQKFTQTDTDFMLRKRIQELVKDTKAIGGKVHCARIYEGICSHQNFYTNLMKNQYRVAWLLQPINSYQDLLEESLYFAYKRIRNEVLTMPITEKTAPLMLNAFKMLADRVMGPVVQRMESKAFNVNVDGNKALGESINPEDLMQRYADLKSKLVSAPKEVDEPG
jgi:hypothetical protein